MVSGKLIKKMKHKNWSRDYIVRGEANPNVNVNAHGPNKKMENFFFK